MSISRVAVVPSGSDTVMVEMVLAMSRARSTLSGMSREWSPLEFFVQLVGYETDSDMGFYAAFSVVPVFGGPLLGIADDYALVAVYGCFVQSFRIFL